MIWLERIRGLIRSSSVTSSAGRMESPACRTSAWLSRVDLQHAVEALHDLHAGGDVRRLQGDVGDPVDLDPRGDLDHEAGLALLGQEPLRHRRLEGGELRLQAVEKDVGSQIDHLAPRFAGAGS